ncbi:MAG: hypothetical protein H6737_00785 [Alphaproteobacteria bacterium]|nr:hypothetical protein [Alphaproteobacteria bacterium]
MHRLAPLALLLVSCTQDYTIGAQPVQVNPEDVTECGFTEVAFDGTQASLFRRYDCNPVFTDSGEAWAGGVRSTGFHAEVVLGHPFYQMWYTADEPSSGSYGLGYAISADGTNWEPQPANPLLTQAPPTWRASSMDGVTVVWDSDAMQYVLAYQGLNLNTGDNGLGFMTSDDGQSWVALNADRPVFDLTVPVNGVRYCWPLALTHTPGEGLRGYIAGGPDQSGVCQVYTIAGSDVNNLAPNNSPVLTAGDTYDAGGMAAAAVVKLEDTYYMFYTGIKEYVPVPGTNFVAANNTTLNVATSVDGINWVKSPDNPIRDIGVTNQPSKILGIAAQVVGPRVHLWIDDYYPQLDRRATGYFLYEPNPTDAPL